MWKIPEGPILCVLLVVVFLLVFSEGARTTEGGCTYEYLGHCNRDHRKNRCYEDFYSSKRGSINWSNWGGDMSDIPDSCCDELPDDRHCFGVQFYGECWSSSDCSAYKRPPCNKTSKKCFPRDASSDSTDQLGGPWSNAYYCAFRCGRREQSEEKRIVGGAEAADHWPWMGAVYDTEMGDTVQEGLFCGATLISCKWVLTANYCTNYEYPLFDQKLAQGQIRVLFGKKNIDVSVSSGVRVKSVYRPPEGVAGDAALLELDEPVELSSLIYPICLDDSKKRKKKRFVAAGWGSTKTAQPPGPMPTELREVTLKQKPCAFPLHDAEMCFDSEQNKGICRGDEGGPYMEQRGGRWYQVAVINYAMLKMQFGEGFSLECGYPGYTEHATRISHPELRGWINQVSGL